MRLIVLLLVVAIAVPAVALAAAVDPKAPRQRHVAADMTKAAKLTLRRSDLAAGWKADPPAKAEPYCTAGPDESSLVQTAKVDPSFTWKDNVTNVGSEVDMFRTAAEARKDWRLSTLGLVKTCLLQSARAGVGKTVKVAIVSARELVPPKGVERSLHFRFVFELRSKQTARLVADVLAIGSGRTTVVLHTLTVQTPLPSAVVNALAKVLAGRLSAGKGGITA
ncbi:MAG: hypothetical protein QOF28_3213 [Actinomycetota bacterium]|nr:hypothetical protein [Actinomycetota bacterium]